jgi:potassium channel subfamily K
MGYDHAEQRELHPPGAASSSSSGAGPSESDNEKPKDWDKRESADSIATVQDVEGKPPPQQPPQRRHHHHPPKRHTRLGFNLRAADDDLPTNWWFASTAIPLIAATFAPMANLLSIAALVVSWRNNVVEPRDPVYYQATSVGYPDPSWCIDLNVASLVCGFVGNLFLLFNFTKRVRYIVALPATIVFFYLASGILIGITVSMHMYCPPGDNQVYSQGFWNAVLAASLYMFNSMILMVNMLGYFLGHYPQHFTLNDEQRNLILQTMMFFVWLGGGAGVFCRIEGWTYPDAVYFCDVTILTVGFGDYYPTDDVGRGIVFPYSVGGIIILGLMVSSIAKFAGELSTVNVLRKHVERRRVDTLSRVVTVDEAEDERRTDLERQIEVDRRNGRMPTISAPITTDLRVEGNLDRASRQLEEEDLDREDLDREDTRRERRNDRRIGFGATHAPDLKPAESEPHARQFLNRAHHKGPLHATFRMITNPVGTLRRARSKGQKALVMREEKDRFDAMRDIQENARNFKRWAALFVSVTAFGTLWCVGAVVFWRAERDTQGLSYFEALYFCYVSLLTIGYGDLSPKSNAGKPFFVVWSLIAVPTMTILISDMADTVISSFKKGTFALGDLTILPKKGLWHELLKANPWIWRWMNRWAEAKRRKAGLPVGPAPDDRPSGSGDLSIDALAAEEPTEAELTSRLAWAIRQTADDLQHAPRKRYSYEEWVEFTRLIRFTKEGLDRLEYDEEVDGVVDWDWLEDSSPMLSGQTESEWVLDRLCESLLRLLKKNRLGGSLTGVNDGSVTDLSTYTVSRQGTHEDTEDKGKSTASAPPTPHQERRRRASGADAVLAFFTGARPGDGDHQSYADAAPQWSKKARAKMKEKRRASSGASGVKRRGPFSRLEHGLRSGAVGGGRGGAGLRTLKMRHMTGNAEGKRFPREES